MGVGDTFQQAVCSRGPDQTGTAVMPKYFPQTPRPKQPKEESIDRPRGIEQARGDAEREGKTVCDLERRDESCRSQDSRGRRAHVDTEADLSGPGLLLNYSSKCLRKIKIYASFVVLISRA